MNYVMIFLPSPVETKVAISFPFIAIATLDFFDSSGHTFQYHFHSICHIFEHKNQWLAELNNEINVHVKIYMPSIQYCKGFEKD